ncbi:hypothetical protein K505DRAFT_65997 [Melanomma pulvis-pyrius CBS 109.77]|uniref:Uncharacterized protein n=1 Tax=Melanomma pulvis-pyrius CBS 109.77 TaxID=1314802 RepID=A0A6A6X5M7_9PLEO|nr:hypothetical protein K505DRAFT_65997 [Melanomma pulvis-pyrius CBS 109.77]
MTYRKHSSRNYRTRYIVTYRYSLLEAYWFSDWFLFLSGLIKEVLPSSVLSDCRRNRLQVCTLQQERGKSLIGKTKGIREQHSLPLYSRSPEDELSFQPNKMPILKYDIKPISSMC